METQDEVFVSEEENVGRTEVPMSKETYVDEENDIVEPDVDVHFFGIIIDVPFANIGAPNLVPNDVLKGEDVDVVIPNGFVSDT
nr:hypothetical protein [Tanacetum cinerariifolium]